VAIPRPSASAATPASDTQQRLWDHFWAPGSTAPDQAEAFATGQLAGTLGLLSRWLGDAPWFGGDRLLFADYYVLSVLDEAAGFFPEAVEREPALADYRRRMYARPGLAAYVAAGRQSPWFGFDPHRGLRGPDGHRAP
jgi:glutathione S-transferase